MEKTVKGKVFLYRYKEQEEQQKIELSLYQKEDLDSEKTLEFSKREEIFSSQIFENLTKEIIVAFGEIELPTKMEEFFLKINGKKFEEWKTIELKTTEGSLRVYSCSNIELLGFWNMEKNYLILSQINDISLIQNVLEKKKKIEELWIDVNKNDKKYNIFGFEGLFLLVQGFCFAKRYLKSRKKMRSLSKKLVIFSLSFIKDREQLDNLKDTDKLILFLFAEINDFFNPRKKSKKWEKYFEKNNPKFKEKIMSFKNSEVVRSNESLSEFCNIFYFEKISSESEESSSSCSNGDDDEVKGSSGDLTFSSSNLQSNSGDISGTDLSKINKIMGNGQEISVIEKEKDASESFDHSFQDILGSEKKSGKVKENEKNSNQQNESSEDNSQGKLKPEIVSVDVDSQENLSGLIRTKNPIKLVRSENAYIPPLNFGLSLDLNPLGSLGEINIPDFSISNFMKNETKQHNSEKKNELKIDGLKSKLDHKKIYPLGHSQQPKKLDIKLPNIDTIDLSFKKVKKIPIPPIFKDIPPPEKSNITDELIEPELPCLENFPTIQLHETPSKFNQKISLMNISDVQNIKKGFNQDSYISTTDISLEELQPKENIIQQKNALTNKKIEEILHQIRNANCVFPQFQEKSSKFNQKRNMMKMPNLQKTNKGFSQDSKIDTTVGFLNELLPEKNSRKEEKNILTIGIIKGVIDKVKHANCQFLPNGIQKAPKRLKFSSIQQIEKSLKKCEKLSWMGSFEENLFVPEKNEFQKSDMSLKKSVECLQENIQICGNPIKAEIPNQFLMEPKSFQNFKMKFSRGNVSLNLEVEIPKKENLQVIDNKGKNINSDTEAFQKKIKKVKKEITVCTKMIKKHKKSELKELNEILKNLNDNFNLPNYSSFDEINIPDVGELAAKPNQVKLQLNKVTGKMFRLYEGKIMKKTLQNFELIGDTRICLLTKKIKNSDVNGINTEDKTYVKLSSEKGKYSHLVVFTEQNLTQEMENFLENLGNSQKKTVEFGSETYKVILLKKEEYKIFTDSQAVDVALKSKLDPEGIFIKNNFFKENVLVQTKLRRPITGFVIVRKEELSKIEKCVVRTMNFNWENYKIDSEKIRVLKDEKMIKENAFKRMIYTDEAGPTGISMSEYIEKREIKMKNIFYKYNLHHEIPVTYERKQREIIDGEDEENFKIDVLINKRCFERTTSGYIRGDQKKIKKWTKNELKKENKIISQKFEKLRRQVLKDLLLSVFQDVEESEGLEGDFTSLENEIQEGGEDSYSDLINELKILFIKNKSEYFLRVLKILSSFLANLLKNEFAEIIYEYSESMEESKKIEKFKIYGNEVVEKFHKIFEKIYKKNKLGQFSLESAVNFLKLRKNDYSQKISKFKNFSTLKSQIQNDVISLTKDERAIMYDEMNILEILILRTKFKDINEIYYDFEEEKISKNFLSYIEFSNKMSLENREKVIEKVEHKIKKYSKNGEYKKSEDWCSCFNYTLNSLNFEQEIISKFQIKIFEKISKFLLENKENTNEKILQSFFINVKIACGSFMSRKKNQFSKFGDLLRKIKKQANLSLQLNFRKILFKQDWIFANLKKKQIKTFMKILSDTQIIEDENDLSTRFSELAILDENSPHLFKMLREENFDFDKEIEYIIEIGNKRFKEKFEEDIKEIDLFKVLFIDNGDIEEYLKIIDYADIQIFKNLAHLISQENFEKFKKYSENSIHVRFIESAWSYYLKAKTEELQIKDFSKYIKSSMIEGIDKLFKGLMLIFQGNIKEELEKKKKMVEKSLDEIVKKKKGNIKNLRKYQEFIPENLIEKEEEWFDIEIEIGDKETPLRMYKTAQEIPIYEEISKRENEYFNENYKKMIQWEKFETEILDEKQKKLDEKDQVKIPEYFEFFQAKTQEFKDLIEKNSKSTNLKIYKIYFKKNYNEKEFKFKSESVFNQIFEILQITEEVINNLESSIKDALRFQTWQKISNALEKFREEFGLKQGSLNSFSSLLFKFMENRDLVDKDNDEKFSSENYSKLIEGIKNFNTEIIFSKLDLLTYLSKSKHYLNFLDQNGEGRFKSITPDDISPGDNYKFYKWTQNVFKYFFYGFKKLKTTEGLIDFVINMHSKEENVLNNLENIFKYFSSKKNFKSFENNFNEINQTGTTEKFKQIVKQVVNYNYISFFFDEKKEAFSFKLNLNEILSEETEEKVEGGGDDFKEKTIHFEKFKEYYQKCEISTKKQEEDDEERDIFRGEGGMNRLIDMYKNLSTILEHLNDLKRNGFISMNFVGLEEFKKDSSCKIMIQFEELNGKKISFFEIMNHSEEIEENNPGLEEQIEKNNSGLEEHIIEKLKNIQVEIEDFFDDKFVSGIDIDLNRKILKNLHYFNGSKFYILKQCVLEKLGAPQEITDYQKKELKNFFSMIEPGYNPIRDFKPSEDIEIKPEDVKEVGEKSLEAISKILELDINRPETGEKIFYPFCNYNKISFYYEDQKSEMKLPYFEIILRVLEKHKISQLKNIQILNCQESTIRREVLAFCELSMLRSKDEAYLVLFPEKLEDEIFYEMIKKFEESLEKRYNDGNKEHSNNTLLIFKNLDPRKMKKLNKLKNSGYFSKYSMSEKDGITFKNKLKKIKVIYSQEAGMGKTEYIKEYSKNNLMKLYLCGDLEESMIRERLRDLSVKLQSLDPSEKIDLWINLDSFKELEFSREKVDFILFQTCILKNVGTENGILSMKKVENIYIEVGNILGYKNLKNMFSSISYLKTIEAPFNGNSGDEEKHFVPQHLKYSEDVNSDEQIVAFCHASLLNDCKQFGSLLDMTLSAWQAQRNPIPFESFIKLLNGNFLRSYKKSERREITYAQYHEWLRICAYFFRRIDDIDEFNLEELKKERRESLRKDFVTLVRDFASGVVQLSIKETKLNQKEAEKINDNFEEEKKNIGNNENKEENFDLNNILIPFVKDGKFHIFRTFENRNIFRDKNLDTLRNQLNCVTYWEKKWNRIRKTDRAAKERYFLEIFSSILGYELEDAINRKNRYPNLEENKEINDSVEEGFILTQETAMKISLFSLKALIGLPIVLMGEAGCGKTYLTKYIAAGINRETIYTITLHAGVKESQFLEFLRAPLEQALRIPEKKVWVMFDEFNTNAGLQSLVAEIMNERSCSISKDFPSISENVVFVGCCNPFQFRKDKIGAGLVPDTAENSQAHKVYVVNPSLLNSVSNIGKLKKDDEKEHIKSKIRNSRLPWLKKKYKGEDPGLIDVVTVCLNQSLKRVRWYEGSEAGSMRDIGRFILFLDKIHDYLSKTKTLKYLGENEKEIENLELMSILLAVKLCYVYRLNWKKVYKNKKKSKKKVGVWGKTFPEILHGLETFSNKFKKLIKEENSEEIIESQMKQILTNFAYELKQAGYIPKETAINTPLKENLFSLLICYATKTPLLICGKPGTSKTLCSQIFCNAMSGHTSKDDKKIKLDSFRVLNFVAFSEVYYGGSKTSTSEGIEKVFITANTQIGDDKDKTLQPLIIIDEIGCAEQSPHRPLKILHPYLENKGRGYSFLAISNWSLDLSKTSRMNVVTRGDMTLVDFQDTYKEIVQKKLDVNMNCVIKAYLSLRIWQRKNATHKDFHGSRDVYSFFKFIKNSEYHENDSKKQKNFERKLEIVKEGIERNFGGDIYQCNVSKIKIENDDDEFVLYLKGNPKYGKYVELLQKSKSPNLYNLHDESNQEIIEDEGKTFLEKSSQKVKRIFFKKFCKEKKNEYLDLLQEENTKSFYYNEETVTRISQNIKDKNCRFLLLFTESSLVDKLILSEIKKIFKKDINLVDMRDIKTKNSSSSKKTDMLPKLRIHLADPEEETRETIIVFKNNDDLYDSLYDLFNQKYMVEKSLVEEGDEKGEENRYCYLSLDDMRMKARVASNIKIIVLADMNEKLNNADKEINFPAPFLNRFEKFNVSLLDILNTGELDMVNSIINMNLKMIEGSESFMMGLTIELIVSALKQDNQLEVGNERSKTNSKEDIKLKVSSRLLTSNYIFAEKERRKKRKQLVKNFNLFHPFDNLMEALRNEKSEGDVKKMDTTGIKKMMIFTFSNIFTAEIILQNEECREELKWEVIKSTTLEKISPSQREMKIRKMEKENILIQIVNRDNFSLIPLIKNVLDKLISEEKKIKRCIILVHFSEKTEKDFNLNNAGFSYWNNWEIFVIEDLINSRYSKISEIISDDELKDDYMKWIVSDDEIKKIFFSEMIFKAIRKLGDDDDFKGMKELEHEMKQGSENDDRSEETFFFKFIDAISDLEIIQNEIKEIYTREKISEKYQKSGKFLKIEQMFIQNSSKNLDNIFLKIVLEIKILFGFKSICKRLVLLHDSDQKEEFAENLIEKIEEEIFEKKLNSINGNLLKMEIIKIRRKKEYISSFPFIHSSIKTCFEKLFSGKNHEISDIISKAKKEKNSENEKLKDTENFRHFIEKMEEIPVEKFPLKQIINHIFEIGMPYVFFKELTGIYLENKLKNSNILQRKEKKNFNEKLIKYILHLRGINEDDSYYDEDDFLDKVYELQFTLEVHNEDLLKIGGLINLFDEEEFDEIYEKSDENFSKESVQILNQLSYKKILLGVKDETILIYKILELSDKLEELQISSGDEDGDLGKEINFQKNANILRSLMKFVWIFNNKNRDPKTPEINYITKDYYYDEFMAGFKKAKFKDQEVIFNSLVILENKKIQEILDDFDENLKEIFLEEIYQVMVFRTEIIKNSDLDVDEKLKLIEPFSQVFSSENWKNTLLNIFTEDQKQFFINSLSLFYIEIFDKGINQEENEKYFFKFEKNFQIKENCEELEKSLETGMEIESETENPLEHILVKSICDVYMKKFMEKIPDNNQDYFNNQFGEYLEIFINEEKNIIGQLKIISFLRSFMMKYDLFNDFLKKIKDFDIQDNLNKILKLEGDLDFEPFQKIEMTTFYYIVKEMNKKISELSGRIQRQENLEEEIQENEEEEIQENEEEEIENLKKLPFYKKFNEFIFGDDKTRKPVYFLTTLDEKSMGLQKKLQQNLIVAIILEDQNELNILEKIEGFSDLSEKRKKYLIGMIIINILYHIEIEGMDNTEGNSIPNKLKNWLENDNEAQNLYDEKFKNLLNIFFSLDEIYKEDLRLFGGIICHFALVMRVFEEKFPYKINLDKWNEDKIEINLLQPTCMDPKFYNLMSTLYYAFVIRHKESLENLGNVNCWERYNTNDFGVENLDGIRGKAETITGIVQCEKCFATSIIGDCGMPVKLPKETEPCSGILPSTGEKCNRAIQGGDHKFKDGEKLIIYARIKKQLVRKVLEHYVEVKDYFSPFYEEIHEKDFYFQNFDFMEARKKSEEKVNMNLRLMMNTFDYVFMLLASEFEPENKEKIEEICQKYFEKNKYLKEKNYKDLKDYLKIHIKNNLEGLTIKVNYSPLDIKNIDKIKLMNDSLSRIAEEFLNSENSTFLLENKNEYANFKNAPILKGNGKIPIFHEIHNTPLITQTVAENIRLQQNAFYSDHKAILNQIEDRLAEFKIQGRNIELNMALRLSHDNLSNKSFKVHLSEIYSYYHLFRNIYPLKPEIAFDIFTGKLKKNPKLLLPFYNKVKKWYSLFSYYRELTWPLIDVQRTLNEEFSYKYTKEETFNLTLQSLLDESETLNKKYQKFKKVWEEKIEMIKSDHPTLLDLSYRCQAGNEEGNFFKIIFEPEHIPLCEFMIHKGGVGDTAIGIRMKGFISSVLNWQQKVLENVQKFLKRKEYDSISIQYATKENIIDFSELKIDEIVKRNMMYDLRNSKKDNIIFGTEKIQREIAEEMYPGQVILILKTDTDDNFYLRLKEEEKEDLKKLKSEIFMRIKPSENEEALKNIEEDLRSTNDEDWDVIEKKLFKIFYFCKKNVIYKGERTIEEYEKKIADDDTGEMMIHFDETEGSEKVNKYKLEECEFILDLIEKKKNIQEIKENKDKIYYEEFDQPKKGKEEIGEDGGGMEELTGGLKEKFKIFEAAKKHLRMVIEEISNEEKIKKLNEFEIYFRDLVKSSKYVKEKVERKLSQLVYFENSGEFEWVSRFSRQFFDRISGRFFKLLVVELENLISRLQDKI